MEKIFYYVVGEADDLLYICVVESQFFDQHGHMANSIDEEDEDFSEAFREMMERHRFFESMECVYEFDGTKEELEQALKQLPFLQWNERFQEFLDSLANGH